MSSDPLVSARAGPSPASETGAPTAAVAELAHRARAGDRHAFQALHRRFAPMVHGILLASTRAQDVDDLVQEVFLDAWRGIAGLRDADRVGGWLATLARNAARRIGRRAPRPLAPLPAEVVDRRPSAGSATEILEIVRGLPEAYRETLALRLVEGMTGPEIAAATGLTPGSVRVNLTRGMKRLRARLREEGYR